MALLRRRTVLPHEIRARIGLPSGDRVIDVAELDDGWAVASVGGLCVVRTGRSRVTFRPWTLVDGARLDPADAHLIITWVDGVQPTVLALTDERSTLPQTVRERVQSSVVHTERVRLASGGLVRVALRRGADGGLFTQVIGTVEVDLDDPATARAVEVAESRVREAAGLP